MWTTENRARYDRSKLRYPSDLTDDEWQLIEPLIPPGKPGEKPQYHYHAHRESLIQILSGDVTEMVEGKAVRLKPGDVIYIAPGAKHAMLNNSTTVEVKYMEFFTPISPDNVQVKD